MSLLRTEAVNKSFGGLHAVRDVGLSLDKGEIRAVIGPNGAGKTTLVSIISGRLAPSSGRIFFKEQDITGLKSWQRARAGIVYTFQITSIFQNLSCAENLALALQQRRMRGLAGHLRLEGAALAAEVAAGLERIGLAAAAEQPASTLPYGHQRLLEVAMGLGLAPELLIMDEPTQGLSNEEIGRFCALTREIAREATVLLIEHNMPVVMELADRITVIENGAVLAEGTPEEIRANAAVQQAYLGA